MIETIFITALAFLDPKLYWSFELMFLTTELFLANELMPVELYCIIILISDVDIIQSF